MAVDKETLLKRCFGVETVDIPGVGEVEVRALSRAEAMLVNGKEMTVLEMEQILLSTAMVSPKLSREEVAAWQDNMPAGLFEPVIEKITQISGMVKNAPKSGVS